MSRPHSSGAKTTLPSARDPWFPRPKQPTNRPSPRAWEKLQRGFHRMFVAMGLATVGLAVPPYFGTFDLLHLLVASAATTATLDTARRWSVDKPRGESATVFWYVVRTGLLTFGVLMVSFALAGMVSLIVWVGAGFLGYGFD